MDRGIVQNWEDMELVWHHAFYQSLCIAPEEHPILLTEAPLNPRSNREQMAETMYETFNVPALYIIISAALVLYSSGHTSGLVVDSGDGLTFAVPFYEGAAIIPSIRRLELAGRDLTRYLVRLMSEKGFAFQSSSGFDLTRKIKEKLAEVAFDFRDQLRSPPIELEESYSLPDGQILKLTSERFRCAEALFDPSQLGIEAKGIQKLAYESIMKCDVDVRKCLYQNVIVSGGTTTLKGFVKRFEKSLTDLFPSTLQGAISINAPNDRLYSTWVGGSILSSLSTFKYMWIDKKEYQEVGSSVVSKKCF